MNKKTTKPVKHADADASAIAVCAEESAAYSGVDADASADNKKNSISRAKTLCYIEKRSFYEMYHGFIL